MIRLSPLWERVGVGIRLCARQQGNHEGCPYRKRRSVGVGFANALGEGTSPLRSRFWATTRVAPTGIDEM